MRIQNHFKLSQHSTQWCAERYGTPLLVLSCQQIADNYTFLSQQLPNVRIYYAVKSNPDEQIIKTLAALGSCFDVASDGEIMTLTNMGISSDRMVYANPVKTNGGFKACQQVGVDKFTFDSESEIYKMAKAVPGGKVLLRIRIDNSTALVDLNKKFGAHPEEALRLISIAKDQGLDIAGLCFHVGSQATFANVYIDALNICRKIFDEAALMGIQLRILDIGGGFPIPAIGQDIDVKGMTDKISAALGKISPNGNLG